jgi:excisionase family DNA binding protein
MTRWFWTGQKVTGTALSDSPELPPRGEATRIGGMDMEDQLLTITEAARRTRLSARTLTRAAEAGRLAVVRIGRAVRVRPEDLDQFVADHRTERSRR